MTEEFKPVASWSKLFDRPPSLTREMLNTMAEHGLMEKEKRGRLLYFRPVRNRKPRPITIEDRKLKDDYGQWHPEGIIQIDPGLAPKKDLEIIIHESLHEFFVDMSEAEVTAKARQLRDILWCRGYRRIHLDHGK